MSAESVMPPNHLVLCCALLPLPPAFSLFQSQAIFQWLSSSHQMAKDWGFSFSINPSNEYSEFISFRIDWFGILAVHGTFKSLLQHHILIASILQCSAFFMVQQLHRYMTTGKTTVLTIRNFVGKIMSLLFNMLSRFISFSCKEQASFNFTAAVTVHSDFGAKEKKVCHCYHCFPIYLP